MLKGIYSCNSSLHGAWLSFYVITFAWQGISFDLSPVLLDYCVTDNDRQ